MSGQILQNDYLRLEVSPSTGGAVVGFDFINGGGTHPIFRRCMTDITDGLSPLDTSCFPLLPYSNRLRDGCFIFDGTKYNYPLNCPPEIHASHGDAWMRPWDVTSQSKHHIEMNLGPTAEQPIKYSAIQVFRLLDTELSISLQITNVGMVKSPFGMGLHPYFSREDDTQIICNLESQWELDRDLMPVRLIANQLYSQMHCGIDIKDLPEAGAYFGQSADAEIIWPSSGLRVRVTTISSLRHAIIWCPAGQKFFCYEPVSHMVDGFNMAEIGVKDTGVIYLDPGESYKAVWTFSIFEE
jgi:aldose 1-epimerase